MKLIIHFEYGQENRWSDLFGPYEFVQLTYNTLRAGENGEIELAIYEDEHWQTRDGQAWSDVIIAPAHQAKPI